MLRWQGQMRRTPPLGTIPSVLRLRGREAPVDLDFRSWAEQHSDERIAAMLSAGAGVYTFHHDPGELSAAFLWPRTVRTLLSPPPAARYVIGAWNSLVANMETRARELGVIDPVFTDCVRVLEDGAVQFYLRDPGGNLIEINGPVGDYTTEDIPELKPLTELHPQGPETAGARLVL